jgi:hypothetical protein
VNDSSNAIASPSHLEAEPGRTKVQRSGAARIAAIGLAVVLLILPAFALVAALVTYQAGIAARHASHQSDFFDDARYAVAAEESLERKYRLEPSKEVHERHHQAAAALVESLARAPQARQPTSPRSMMSWSSMSYI